MSRNRYIIRALERALATETGWSTEFVEELAAARADIDGRRGLEELRALVAASRTRKGPPTLGSTHLRIENWRAGTADSTA